MKNKIKIAVLMGGPSGEYDISLKTGYQVLENIDGNKYEAHGVKIDKEKKWEIGPENLKKNFDIVFIALHGEYGEDGVAQGELEAVNMPYTSSNSQVSALCMNKYLSLQLLQDAGLVIPQTLHLDFNDWKNNPDVVIQKAKLFVEAPYVIKPNRGGSSLDMIISNDSKDIGLTLGVLFEEYRDLIIQPFIDGREVTCGVLDQGVARSAYSLSPTEIIPRLSHYYDYKSKYEVDGAKEITPARFSDSWVKEIKSVAKQTHTLLGCRGVSRVDMIVGKDNKIYILEVNTIPELTNTSLLLQEAKEKGISFSELIDRIINAGFRMCKVELNNKDVRLN